METTEIARELRLVHSLHECCPGPVEQGIPQTGFECFPSIVKTICARSFFYSDVRYTHLREQRGYHPPEFLLRPVFQRDTKHL